MKQCPNCNLLQADGVFYCSNCGQKLPEVAVSPQPQIQQPQQYYHAPPIATPKKNFFKPRILCGIIAILFGGFGVHKFMFRKGTGGVSGIFYLLFCWSGVPAVIGILEGIRYFCLTDNQFEEIMTYRFVPPQPPRPPVYQYPTNSTNPPPM